MFYACKFIKKRHVSSEFLLQETESFVVVARDGEILKANKAPAPMRRIEWTIIGEILLDRKKSAECKCGSAEGIDLKTKLANLAGNLVNLYPQT